MEETQYDSSVFIKMQPSLAISQVQPISGATTATGDDKDFQGTAQKDDATTPQKTTISLRQQPAVTLAQAFSDDAPGTIFMSKKGKPMFINSNGILQYYHYAK